jgi:hypothetical protein
LIARNSRRTTGISMPRCPAISPMLPIRGFARLSRRHDLPTVQSAKTHYQTTRVDVS